jgi:hypothetical protein
VCLCLAALVSTAAADKLRVGGARCCAGFDATALLHQLRQGSLFSVDGGGGGGTLTSVADMEQLIAAAREEIRKAGRTKSKKAE